MKQKHINFKSLSFDELSEIEKKEAISKYYDINIDFDSWNDYILNDFVDELKQKTNLEIEAKNINWEVGSRNSKFLIPSKILINEFLAKFENKIYDIDIPLNIGSGLSHLGGGICSQITTEKSQAKIYFEDEISETEKTEISNKINSLIDDVIYLCKKYHLKNEEAYTYETSNEAIIETIKANEITFEFPLNENEED